MVLDDLLQMASDSRASDIFLKSEAPPAMRVDGKIRSMGGELLLGEQVRDMAYSVMSPEQIGKFERRHEMDLAFTFQDLARFRVNVYQQRGTVGMVLRLIPLKIYTLDDLNMPETLAQMCNLRQGLILVTGPTGSGKSTTLAATIDRINGQRSANIVTVEDPIEFVHQDKKSIV
ncbi:MAG: ATPase, T2SS/T4P/T4SS family, partial [Armatimonadota bacterium]